MHIFNNAYTHIRLETPNATNSECKFYLTWLQPNKKLHNDLAELRFGPTVSHTEFMPSWILYVAKTFIFNWKTRIPQQNGVFCSQSHSSCLRRSRGEWVAMISFQTLCRYSPKHFTLHSIGWHCQDADNKNYNKYSSRLLFRCLGLKLPTTFSALLSVRSSIAQLSSCGR